jgi:uncharacterized protein (TIGR03437 family)
MRLLLALAAALPLLGQTTNPCTSYSLSSGGFVETSTATDTSNPNNIPSFKVTTQTGCPFVAATAASWIHIVPPSSGSSFSGTSQVSFTVDQNAGSQLREDQIVIYISSQIAAGEQTLALPVIQLASLCTYTIAPASAALAAAGGPGSFNLTTGCTWGVSFSSPNNFVQVTIPTGTPSIPSGFIGSSAINYQAAANLCTSPRTAQVTVQTSLPNPPIFQLTQSGSASNFTISSTSLAVAAAALTNQHVTVTTGGYCNWTTYTDSNWLHTGTPIGGTGTGVYSYSVDANQGGQRTGHIYFQSGYDLTGNPVPAGTLTVTQQAYQPPAPQLTGIVNGASYDIGSTSPAPISPGEIVALAGANLGPVPGLSYSQTFATSLGGVQVMFGATAAPLIYVSAQQINAVVPYAVALSTSVPVTVQYNGASATVPNVPVQAATPGIFSYDSSGTGPGAILNQDYSLNSAARPAAVGTVVFLYCTGAGVTVPASKDGALASLTPPFPVLATQPVTVTIGGISAQVVYAGPAPGSINGLTQINAVVPNGVKSGPSIPVVVTIGGVPSQGNLSMAVN